MSILHLLVTFVLCVLKSQRQLVVENIALRQQVAMLRQSVKRPCPSVADRLFWIIYSRYVNGWRDLLHSLHPDTVVRWHRQGFVCYWRWKSRGSNSGRPPINSDLRKLIREMQATNIGWGAPASARLESTENCLSWVLKFLRLQCPNSCNARISPPHKRGEHFSTIT